MIISPKVPLHRLILSLSEAIDHVHPQIMDHQLRVAYISIRMGRQLGLDQQELLDLFQAAALHDIGLIGTQSKLRAIGYADLEGVEWHSQLGYELLKENPLFSNSAEIIKHHHAVWQDTQNSDSADYSVPFSSHIIAVADAVEIALKSNIHVLNQSGDLVEKITLGLGTDYNPHCVEAFLEVSETESFWLDLVNPRLYSAILKEIDWPVITIDEVAIGPIGEIFARIVDCASQWTMVHTAGVATSAEALAGYMNFSTRERYLMRAAGYLHDLGKLTVPTEILDKPGRLTPQEMAIMRSHTYHTFRILDTIGGMPHICEWASFHHERLDGKGYPFHHNSDNLTLGAQIMAVADIFTAVTEDRPYRKGMNGTDTLNILDKLAANGGISPEVVSVLHQNFEEIDQLRRYQQNQYRQGQDKLVSLIGNMETQQTN